MVESDYMYRYFIRFFLFVFLAACDNSDQQAPAESARSVIQPPPAFHVGKATLEETALLAIQTMSDTLKNELTTAMQAGGPVNALSVCNVRAPVIAEEISREHDVQISRTSLKYRNPANAPNEWQTAVLEEFEMQKAAGENPASLVYSKVMDNQFRFMKAIPTGALCVTCHGTNISPEVTAELARLYPQDKATGFKEGDIRGAFVVVKDLKK